MADMFTRERRSEIMANIRSVDTVPEVRLRKLVHSLGYRFRLHRVDLPGRPDLVLPRHKVAIQMYGCFWHGHSCKDGRKPSSNTGYWNQKLERNVSRDKKNVAALRRLGWRCLVIWECQLKKTDQLLRRIARYLEAGTK